MASRPSLYNEERNLQRIRERERRNQEVHQEKDPYFENVPLFGEPYKTNKGDELSSRIQRMLGNYEDVRELLGCSHPQIVANAPKNLQAQNSYKSTTHMDKTTYPCQPPPPRLPQSDLRCDSSSEPLKKFCVPEQGQLPSSSCSLDPGSRSPDPQWSGGKSWLEPSECVSLPPVLSPPADPLSPLHSSNPSDTEANDVEDKESLPSHGPFTGNCSSSSPEAQKDVPQVEAAVHLSQALPPPLASKSSQFMLQKPTAYVRPMDGQDQAPVESPELKPSPENIHRQSYENLPRLKSNKTPNFSKLNVPPHSAEASSDAQCVEDILREMTHTWPPLLTAIRTPNKAETPKFSFLPKESQHVHPGISGQKSYGSSPKALPVNCQPGSSTAQGSVASAHSSGAESGSSSDSENTSESESDSESSESGGEKVSFSKRSNPPVTDTPVANKWQLDNWLVKVNQQNSNSENMGDAVQSPCSVVQNQQQKETGREDYKRNYKSHSLSLQCDISNSDAKLVDEASVCPSSCQKSPSQARSTEQRVKVGNKHLSKAVKVPTNTQPSLMVESMEVPVKDKGQTFRETQHLKTKPLYEKAGSRVDAKKPAKHVSTKKNLKETSPKETLSLECKKEQITGRLPSPGQAHQPSPLVPKTGVDLGKPAQKGPKKARGQFSAGESRQALQQKDSLKPPLSLVVKIDLGLLSRIPHAKTQSASPAPMRPLIDDIPSRKKKKKKESSEVPSSLPRKRSAEKDENAVPMKKLNLDKGNKASCSHGSSSNTKLPKSTLQEKDKRKAKKGLPPLVEPPPCVPLTARELQEEPGHKRQGIGDLVGGQPTVKHKKSQAKCTDQPKTSKGSTKCGFTFLGPAQPPEAPLPPRPLLKFEDRQYPVEYHMKEAKKLKHKADATVDKIGKALNYLDAAMSFIESGIAMEADPQTPKSAYTMFSETVDLIRFIMRLKSSLEATGPAAEKDFTVLCMRCQSLLQMAMFRLKREAALKYSRTLSEHFKNSSKSLQAPSHCLSNRNSGTPSSMSPAPPPAGSVSTGLVPNPSSVCGSSATVTIPQVIQQVAASYVNITALFLNAHDTWEQADALIQKGSGLLSDLDSALGPLSLTSSMTLLVRHVRQALCWLRLDTT